MCGVAFPRIQNLHMVEAVYMPATNTKGTRVKLVSHRFKEKVFIAWDYSLDDVLCQAEEYLIKRGHKVCGHCETKDGYGVLIQAEADLLFKNLK